MTEDEAKTKYCPFILAGSNRFDYKNSHSEFVKCKTSECMMWKWDRGQVHFEGTDDNKIKIDFDNPDNGYCGLAK